MISGLAEIQYLASRIRSVDWRSIDKRLGDNLIKAVWEVTAVQCNAVGEWVRRAAGLPLLILLLHLHHILFVLPSVFFPPASHNPSYILQMPCTLRVKKKGKMISTQPVGSISSRGR